MDQVLLINVISLDNVSVRKVTLVNNVILVILQMGTTSKTQQTSVNLVIAMNMEVLAIVVTGMENVNVNSFLLVTNVPFVLLKIALALIVTIVIVMSLVQ